ncbi:MAG TPA: DUF3418 domain-containing protein, partial [Usitatibacteraceae bacterium]|nr:DUF3418 domain-containing protein [Usitatibacteraceae bacterium]
CGRVEAGIAVRLYGEDDFQARPEFTTPEILRTSLADVILRMKSLGLGDVQDFPFVEPPFPKMIEDGYRRLYELGAVDAKKELTPLGWTLSKFPVDPAIARMLVAGGVEGVLEEVLVIAAALSVQDPRNRPHDKQQQADLAHERFVHPQSAFLTFLNLWNFLEDAWKHKKSNRKFDEQLHALFLSPLRVREWRDVHAQLSEVCASSGMRVHAREPALSSAAGRSAARETAAPAQKGRPPAAAPALPDAARSDAIHRALLTGLIGNVGSKAVEGDHYLGPRGMTFYLPRAQQQHAAQKKERLKWLMAAELTETTRVYARHVAAIDPAWIESVAPHLLTRSHFDPHWERKSGQVVAFEQVSLYGLIVNPKRRVHYGAINPAEAREIFIRQGLATGEVDTRGEFLRHNQKLIGEIEDIEAKARRQDILVDENDLFALYDAVVPADVVNLAGFEKWRKEFERTNPSGLKFTAQQLMRRGAGEITQELFPRQLRLASAELPLTYRFEPGHPMDGVTVTVPVAVLNQINAARFEWLVPGLLREKAGALMKSLPQRLRSQLVPLPETVSAFIEFLGFEGGRGNAEPPALQRPLIEALAAFLRRHKGFEVPADAWDVARLAPHLFMNVRVVDEDRQELAMSRDFAALQEQFADRTQTVFSTLHRNRLEREHILAWDFGELPVSINFERERIRYDGFPALVDCGVDVAIRIFDRADVARDAHRQGLVRLALLALHEQARFVERTLKFSPVAAFQYALFFPEAKNHAQDVLRHEVIHAAFAAAFVDRDGAEAQSMRDGTAFARALAAGKPVLMAQADAIARAMEDSLAAVAEVRRRLAEKFISTW